METSQILASVTSMHTEARRRGVFFRTATDDRLVGREITLDGASLVSFSSCSYLGLERHPAVIAGVHDAVDRYGAQFSTSRGYVSAPLYDEMEELLARIFGGHVLVTPSTTMAHLAALPVLATERDAIVLDHQAHHSVHVGANQARAGGALVELVRHDEIERARDVIRALAARCRTVWFATDGVFSMYGDLAPLDLIRDILAIAPNVRVYVDDAHGMSWAGRHGRGSFLSRFPLDPRVVVATSFAKGFGAGGGCLVFADERERDLVRLSGGPLVFSGPMQPPMMGAVVASARLHLSPAIEALQGELRRRVDHVNARFHAEGLELIAVNESPIFFLRVGLPRAAFTVVERAMADGFYLNASVYPTVPMKRAGIRFTVTAAHTLDEIDGAIDRLAVHVPEVLAAEGLSEAHVAERFGRALPDESRRSARYDRPARRTLVEAAGAELRVETADTITAIDRATWDAALGSAGCCSWDAQRAVEVAFRGPLPEHDWRFRYVLVRDRADRLVAATFFTSLLHKDDMLAREDVSRAVEARRASDPYFLTSRVIMMGSNVSEGNHLWLDRAGPWREALREVLAVGASWYEAQGAALLLLRDLPADDAPLEAALLDAGYARVPMLDRHVLDLDWVDDEHWFARIGRRKRKHLRDLAEREHAFTLTVHGAGADPLPPRELDALRRLYREVASRKLKLNVFPFPPELFAELAHNPAWEIAVLRAADVPTPVAFFAAHVHGGHYAPLFCGLDYDHLASHGVYRQLIWQMVKRARALGMSTIHMGMDADLEKARFGARAVPTSVFVQARDHWQGALLREIAAQVAMQRPAEAK